MIAIVAPNVYFVYFAPHIFAMRLFNVAMNAYLLAVSLYGIITFSNRDRIRRILRPFLWLSCLFYLYTVVAGSLLTAMNLTVGIINALSASLYCLPWSIILSVLLFRHFSHTGDPKDMPPDFLREHDITRREGEILSKLLQGESNQEIADASFISLRTVETHLYNIYRKCGVKNRVTLIRKIHSYR